MSVHGRRIYLCMKAVSSLLIVIIIAATVVGSTYAKQPPLAGIQPVLSSYSYETPPAFEIDTGGNTYYQVELALAKHLFNHSFGNRITSTTDIRQNFYSSGYQQSISGQAKFIVPMSIWQNLRGSRVFYRVITSSDIDGKDIRYSTSDANWKDAPFIGRTGELWYGLPLNDRATIGNIDVVVDSRLNGRALSSDYGPRNVTGGTKFHPGIDIPVAIGTPIYAIADGTAVFIPTAGDSMHRLDIDHGEYRSGYVHLSKWLVSLNEEVIAGQLIGYSGDWVGGQHKAAHLHFDSGYDGGQIFHNPLEYVRHTDDHTLSAGSGTFLGDSYTNEHAIDIVNAAGDQHKVLIAFGITTSYDKDLNYVRVQVDNSASDGQYFELDYDNVTSQNSSNGVVTLSNGKTFRIRPLSDDIYGDDDLWYDFYVKPRDTNVDIAARDYFFFPWDITPFENKVDGGPHTIRVSLREVDGSASEITRVLTIGPEITVGSPAISGNQIAYELTVVNHDYQQGNIGLKVEKLPRNWDAHLSNSNPSIPADGSVKVTLTLTTDGPASETPLFENDTRVVATFGRISALKDSAVLCPGQVWIESPDNGSTVEVGSTEIVVVKATEVAENVRLEIEGVEQSLASVDGPSTWNFQWAVPPEPNKPYQLQAFATIDGVSVESGIVKVTSKEPTSTGIVWISKPDDGEEVTAGDIYTVEIGTDPEASQVDLSIDGVRHSMTTADYRTWKYDWTIPEGVETEYQLKAYAMFNGGEVESSPVTVSAQIQENPYEVQFEEPSDGDTILIGQQKTIIVYAPDTAQVNVDSVFLNISPADGYGGGWMTDMGSGRWKYDWTPQPPGGIEQQTYTLVASVYDSNNVKAGEKLIQVFAEGINPSDPWIEGPTLVLIGAQAKFTANAPQANRVTLKLNGNLVCEKDGSQCVFIWIPKYEGKYILLAEAFYEGGVTKTISMEVEAKKAPAMSITSINEYAFLGKIEGLDLDAPLHNGTYVPLPIPSNDYACGVVGYNARGGDIGEHVDYFYTWVPDAIGVFLKPGWDGNYQLVADINTIHWKRIIGDYDEDRPEIWNVNILCVSKSVASVKRFSSLGDNVYKDTGIPINQNICGIAGFWAHGGDIQENGDGNIIQMYLYRQSGNWHIRADFRTHNGSKGGRENWDVDLLCLNADIASLDGPVPNKPFFLREYSNLGDNVGAKRIINTGYSVDDYVCGVAGFAALDGDMDEGNYEGTQTNLFLAYMYPRNGTWHIRADFRTHNDHESWNVNVLCALKDGGTPTQWNLSHEEVGIENCMSEGMKCQVLKDDSINLNGNVILKGGGYTGNPSHEGWRCNSPGEIEVYINDRDHNTGEPRWSWPNTCLNDGESLYLVDGNTYDFRGASFVGGTTTHFKLVDPYAPPVLRTAEGKLFPVPYGPGVALTWTPTLHPLAVYYEIQYFKEGGTAWQVYTNNRDISHGGWVNHHGNTYCGYSFERCLDRKKVYSYRVRVLDSAKNPITEWSNILTARSMDWPAKVNFAAPIPPGPYASHDEITMSLADAYGEGLRLSWQLRPYSGASYTVLSGCESGYLNNADANSCTIRVFSGSNASVLGSGLKLAMLAPVTSIEVKVTGTDYYGYSSYDEITLYFEQDYKGDDRDS